MPNGVERNDDNYFGAFCVPHFWSTLHRLCHGDLRGLGISFPRRLPFLTSE